VTQGGFSAETMADLLARDRNLLIFIHGFDNSFSDAMTAAAFNASWLSASGDPSTDMTVIAFSWPSLGQIFSPPIPWSDYQTDQHMAEMSGPHLMSFIANLDPIIAQARAGTPGIKTILLAHSMGNLALQSAVENWFLNGNGDDPLFDHVILAAGDCPADTFNRPSLARLSGLSHLAPRIGVYYSHADQILQLSMAVNLGTQRLGQNGPPNRTDAAVFPPATYTMVDCTHCQDYDFGFLTSHQYYRKSAQVRQIIAASI
jgi:esterase/lipase superfamily enzyme